MRVLHARALRTLARRAVVARSSRVLGALALVAHAAGVCLLPRRRRRRFRNSALHAHDKKLTCDRSRVFLREHYLSSCAHLVEPVSNQTDGSATTDGVRSVSFCFSESTWLTHTKPAAFARRRSSHLPF